MVHYLISLITTHGYLAVFFFLMLGILGLPIPDEVLMSYVGLLVFQGKLGLLPAVAAAWIGSCCGVSLSYLLGRTFGHTLLLKFHGSPEKVRRVRLWFDRRGKWTLVFGYFMPGVRHVIAIVAGSTELPFHHFALFAWAGGLVWTLTYILLGFYLGQEWVSMSQRMHYLLLLISALLLASVGLYFLIKWLKARRRP